jgi:capsular polysaccharide biosynthesis protein
MIRPSGRRRFSSRIRSRALQIALDWTKRAVRSQKEDNAWRLAAPLALLRTLEALGRDPVRSTLASGTPHDEVATRAGILQERADFGIEPPRAWDSEELLPDDAYGTADGPQALASRSRPVSWSLVENALINDHSLVLKDSKILLQTGGLQDVQAGMRIKGPGLAEHAGGRVLLRLKPPTTQIEAGIRLCGFGSRNWYHWLVEILPTACLIDRLPPELAGLPLLVPEAFASQASWRDSLEAVAPGRPTVVVPRDGTVLVKNLVWIDPAVHGVRTYENGRLPQLSDITPSLPTLDQFRKTVLRELRVQPRAKSGQRILLLRSNLSRPTKNMDAAAEIARGFGFVAIDSGTLSFRDQVRLFAEAEAVVGSWGAAWATMLFASPDTRGLMWASGFFRTWPLFSNLATVSGMTLSHLFIATSSETFGDANASALQLDPAEFASALSAVLSD